jgi:hypothetical protein
MNKKISDMSKAYRSLNSSNGEKYQKSQSMGRAHTEDRAKGTMEPLNASLTHHGDKKSKITTKDVMNKMKYAPKTVSYSEFTSAKNAARMQSMVGSKVDDHSSNAKMENGYKSTLPSHKQQKSFDIDVTKYKPRKAKD